MTKKEVGDSSVWENQVSAARTRGGVKNQDAMATDVLRQTENQPTSKNPMAQTQNRSKAIAKAPKLDGHNTNAKGYLQQALSSYGHRHLELGN